jgi:hypothetical protein
VQLASRGDGVSNIAAADAGFQMMHMGRTTGAPTHIQLRDFRHYHTGENFALPATSFLHQRILFTVDPIAVGFGFALLEEFRARLEVRLVAHASNS